MTFKVEIDVDELVAASDKLIAFDEGHIGKEILPVLNKVAERGFDESRRRMISRVNISDDYVRQRMDLEAANDARKPEAKIIAFRAGGRRSGIRPVNLRQYSAVVQQTETNWSNSGVARNTGKKVFEVGKFYKNPRKPGGKLPFKPRVGDPQQGIPVGKKAAGVSVEVLRGQRKAIDYAFMRRMPNGEVLVMARKKGQKSGKGKIEPLYSLSVWQLFKNAAVEVIPLVRADLQASVTPVVLAEIRKVLSA